MVASVRSRSSDPVGYPCLWVDALTQRVREDGRIVNVGAVIATGPPRAGGRSSATMWSALRTEPPGQACRTALHKC
jgi:transposase-like protein